MKLTMFFGALLLSSAPAFANTNTWNAGFFRWPKAKVAVSYKVMNDNNTSFVIGFIMPESTSADGMLIPSSHLSLRLRAEKKKLEKLLCCQF